MLDRRRYPSRGLSTEPETSRPSEANSTPRRVSSSSKRAAVARRRAIVIAIAALVLAGAGVYLLTGGRDGDGLGGIIGDPGPPTPEFAFELKRVVPETTSETPSRQLRNEAGEVADGVKSTLDELYYDGFVEHDTWGDFGEIEELFDGGARDQAEADLDTITLGASGSETYTFLRPARGTVVVDVLTDPADRPVLALASVRFVGTAEAEDGTFTSVRSSGSFFLRHVEGGWKIYAYRVERDDRSAKGPSASGSATATASATASEGEG